MPEVGEQADYPSKFDLYTDYIRRDVFFNELKGKQNLFIWNDTPYIHQMRKILNFSALLNATDFFKEKDFDRFDNIIIQIELDWPLETDISCNVYSDFTGIRLLKRLIADQRHLSPTYVLSTFFNQKKFNKLKNNKMIHTLFLLGDKLVHNKGVTVLTPLANTRKILGLLQYYYTEPYHSHDDSLPDSLIHLRVELRGLMNGVKSNFMSTWKEKIIPKLKNILWCYEQILGKSGEFDYPKQMASQMEILQFKNNIESINQKLNVAFDDVTLNNIQIEDIRKLITQVKSHIERQRKRYAR